MSTPLDFGHYLGLFVADVPDSYLEKLPKLLEERCNMLLSYKNEAIVEQQYREKYRKWITDDGTIHFGKGYEERKTTCQS